MADWKIGFRPAEYLTLSPVAADAGLRIGGADMFNIYTFTPVEGEADYLIKAKLAYQVSPDCRAQIRVDWVDASGKKFKQLRLIQLPNGGSGGVRSLHVPLRERLKRRLGSNSVFLVFRQAKEDWIELHAFDWLKLLQTEMRRPPSCSSKPLRQLRATHQEAIAFASDCPTFVNRPYDEGLTATNIYRQQQRLYLRRF